MFSINIDGSVQSYNSQTNFPTNDKFSSDLFISLLNKRKPKFIKLTSKNASFQKAIHQSTSQIDNYFCLANYKRQLCQSSLNNNNNIFDLKITDSKINFSAQEVFTTVYLLIVNQLFAILQNTEDEIQWIITIPSLASTDYQIFMRKCLASALNIYNQTNLDKQVKINIENIYTVQEPVAAFMQISYESKVNIKPSEKIYLIDFGGSTIDFSIFQVNQQQQIPTLISQCGLNCGGSYIDQKVLEIITNSLQVTGNLLYLIKAFQKIKSTIFDEDFIQLDLFNYNFDVEVAEINCDQLSDSIAFDSDEKLLLFDKSFFDTILEDIITQVSTQINILFQRFGIPTYVFLTGGFINCRPLRNKIQQFLVKSNVKQTLLAFQPSTSIAMGAARILDHDIHQLLESDIILQFENQQCKIASKSQIIKKIQQFSFIFDLPDKRSFCSLVLNQGEQQFQEIFYTPRFAKRIIVKVSISPFSSSVQVYYSWVFKDLISQEMSSKYDFQEVQLLPLDCRILANMNYLLQVKDKILQIHGNVEDTIILIILYMLNEFSQIFVETEQQITAQSSDIFCLISIILPLLALTSQELKINCLLLGLNIQIIVDIFVLSELFKITSKDIQHTLQTLSYSKIMNILQILQIQSQIFDQNCGIIIQYPSLFYLTDQCFAYKLGKNYYILQQVSATANFIVRLSKGFITQITQPIVWAILTHYQLDQQNSQIFIQSSSRQVYMSIRTKQVQSVKIIQSIQDDFDKIIHLIPLVGKTIITVDRQQYYTHQFQSSQCLVTISSQGENNLDTKFSNLSQFSNCFKLTRNNLLLLSNSYVEMALAENTLSISLVMDLQSLNQQKFIFSDNLIAIDNNIIQTQLVIQTSLPLNLTNKLNSQIVHSKFNTFQFVNISKPEDFSTFSLQNCNCCDDPVNAPNCILNTSQDDFPQFFEICLTCALDDIQTQYKKPYSNMISYKAKDTITTIGDEFTLYPIVQIGQVVFSIFDQVKDLLIKIYQQNLFSSDIFRHCTEHHYLGIPLKDDAFILHCPYQNCKLKFCGLCNTWHSPSHKCIYQLGIKQCKKCLSLYEKSSGCNHVTCSCCGAHNCYVCQDTFTTAQQCYAHLTRKHGGYF
eukprot:EST43542.1 hypothetical protein SS50377_16580 [Spironucleus salmonicida]